MPRHLKKQSRNSGQSPNRRSFKSLAEVFNFVPWIKGGSKEDGGVGIWCWNGGRCYVHAVRLNDDGDWIKTVPYSKHKTAFSIDAEGLTESQWSDFLARLVKALGTPAAFQLLSNEPDEVVEVVQAAPTPAAPAAPAPGLADWMLSSPPTPGAVKPCPNRQRKDVMAAWLTAESTARAAAAAMGTDSLSVAARLAALATGKQGELKQAVEAVEATLAKAGLLAS